MKISKPDLIGIIGLMFFAMVMGANALISSVTLNYPANTIYNASNDAGVYFKLNATVVWTDPTNITNVTFWFKGSNNTPFSFVNSTINGSRTSVTTGDFVFNLSTNTLTEGSFTVIAEARNDSSVKPAGSLNSSSVTFVIDRTQPQVVLSEPYSGSTVVPGQNNDVTFKYTPTDTNFGNCSLHINNQVAKTSTSGTTSSNISTGTINTITYPFLNDNNSVRVVIECIDLAGTKADSSNITFNVVRGAIAPVIKQLQQAEAAGAAPTLQASGGNANNIAGGFAIVPQFSGQGVQQHLQSYGWLYLVVIILGILAYKKFKK